MQGLHQLEQITVGVGALIVENVRNDVVSEISNKMQNCWVNTIGYRITSVPTQFVVCDSVRSFTINVQGGSRGPLPNIFRIVLDRRCFNSFFDNSCDLGSVSCASFRFASDFGSASCASFRSASKGLLWTCRDKWSATNNPAPARHDTVAFRLPRNPTNRSTWSEHVP
jgi:hypothetical protein